jgi:hypothetical protein
MKQRLSVSGAAFSLAATTLSVLAALGVSAPGASAAGAPHSMSAAHHAILCQHQTGRTILRRGAVRVFKQVGPEGALVFGCVKGSTRAVVLWEVGPEIAPGVVETTGSVRQVAGRFLAAEATTSNQYAYSQSIEVFDLRSGAHYPVAAVQEPIDEPAPPGAPRLERFVLAGDGRTVRLYGPPANATGRTGATGATGTSTSTTAAVQTLDLLGFHHLDRQLATSPPGSIAPASLAVNGDTGTWTQNGEQQSASA